MKVAALIATVAWFIFGQCAVHAQTAQPVDGVAAAAPYRLGPGDEVRITVFNEPDLAVQQRLGADGEISVPMLGAISAGGLSTTDLTETLQTRYRDGFLLHPQVSVTVVTYRPFFVVGEVNNPGAFPYAPNLSIASAIATAGGFSRRASRGEVFVKRQGELEEERYPLAASVSLGPGDTIRVGQSIIATLSDFPLGLILR